MGSWSVDQLIVSAKALLQAGHKKILSPGLLSHLSYPSSRPCCACIARGAWTRGPEKSTREAQGWAETQDAESSQQPQLSCRQLGGTLTPSLGVERAFPPAKEGSMEKCSPDLEYQMSCEYQPSPFIVKRI